jgi:hypothetical protein
MSYIAEERRRSCRLPTWIRGLYFLEEKKGEGKECTIINISLNGAGIEFYTVETIRENTKLFLEIFPPDEEETINVEGIIKWVKQGKMDCACGIELTDKLNETQMAILKV